MIVGTDCKSALSGSISIYTNVGNPGDVLFCEATQIKSGNFFTFDTEGKYDFILCTKCDGSQEGIPTFTIIVE
jgi:hypothetical protein